MADRCLMELETFGKQETDQEKLSQLVMPYARSFWQSCIKIMRKGWEYLCTCDFTVYR